MKAISEFVVRVANLAEAEGRLVREKTVEVIAAAMLWLAGALLGVAGLLGVFFALYLGLRIVVHPALAMAVCALFPLGAAVACILLGRRALRGKP